MKAKANKYASALGRLGGRVKGRCKARPAHARRIAMIRWSRTWLAEAERAGNERVAVELRARLERLERRRHV